MDLHIHTPASSDYQQPEIGYLDLLRRAESMGMDIIAFTDHNTVAGYRHMWEEFQQLELLERLKRILPEESMRLAEYRRLLAKILVLPGFEFTATFGFHIIGIFPPDKPVREIEHLLLDLNIPHEHLDEGSATVGASTDVLNAYRTIHEAGGLVIAAHANSSNGVAMRNFPIGGQTKIAYTQDPHLHALEVTDLENKGRSSTANFFNGTKPEYPRRMFCIQGSDTHRLTPDSGRKKSPILGERATDVLLPEVSFQALIELFESNDFARTRPHRTAATPVFDFIRTAREEGPNIVQEFHDSMTVRGGKRYAIVADVCAFANTNGGTIYIGLSGDAKQPVVGITDASNSVSQMEKELSTRISPPLPVSLDLHKTSDKSILRILVPRGDDPPYAVDDSKIYVRSETETELAVRDEIVELVLRRRNLPSLADAEPLPGVGSFTAPVAQPHMPPPAPSSTAVMSDTEPDPPRTGVEVVSVEDRDGTTYYTMRDLRNGNMVKNVTRSSARRLWHYAITTYAKLPADLGGIQWQGRIGLIKAYQQGKDQRYDLVQRQSGTASPRYYFGVTDDGVHGPWRLLVGRESEDD